MGNMNKNKLLSVIVPMYNVEKYLKTCVESIETQTYTPIEIILVDDGSKDSTLRVANNLAAQFDNIKIYSQSNQGQGAARNNGLSHANGDLIAFLDSDDFIEPDMMKTLVDMVDNNNLDFAECSYQDVYCEKNKKSHVHFSNVPSDTVLTGRDFLSIILSYLLVIEFIALYSLKDSNFNLQRIVLQKMFMIYPILCCMLNVQ